MSAGRLSDDPGRPLPRRPAPAPWRLAGAVRRARRALARSWPARLALAALLAGATAGAPVAAAECPPQPQELNRAQVERGMREASDHGFLWRLSRRGHESWLYGTIHIARLDWMFPGPKVLAALQASDTLALELDMLDEDIQRRLGQVVRAVPDAPALPAPLAARLRAHAERACVGAGLDALRPEIQVVTLSALALRDRDLHPGYGVDGYLAGLARGLRKPVLSLESPESQIAVLLQDSPEATRQMVAEALDELDSGAARRITERLALAWADSRLDELESYPEWCQCLDTDARRADMRRLLDDRNGPLAAAIQAQHDRGRRLFVGVGALHMVGPQGLPTLLAARGFKVERIRFGRTTAP